MRNELAIYLYQSNQELLTNFKKGVKGEEYFSKFIFLVNEESKTTYEESLLSSFKNEKNGERAFVKFMDKVREELVPFKQIILANQEVRKINEEISEIQKEFNDIK
ncbi:hypothetical protein ACDX66_02115 [Peribacillus frigoritolerans]